MKSSSRFRGLLRYIYTRWPAYLAAYGALILLLVGIGVSADRGWFGFIPLALAVFLVIGYGFIASLWAAHQLYDRDGLRPHHALFDMGQIRETDSVAFIDLGLRRQAIALGRRLTTGEMIVVDVYNPQWMTSGALARGRKRRPQPPQDPRFVWRDGRLDLLPLPDRSVTAVILCEVLSALWQEGDRERLLAEAYRVLVPNGRLLLTERLPTQTNWLIMGPAALTLLPNEHWRSLVTRTGFQLRRQKNLDGLIHCYRADKPIPAQARQLRFDIPVDA